MKIKKSHIYIIGTGIVPGDMSARALELIAGAGVLVGGRRLLARFAGTKAEKVVIGRSAEKHVQALKGRLHTGPVVVLASGDPNFFGLAALFYKHYRADQLSVIPNVTALQWACAYTHQPLQNMSVVSVHGRPLSALDQVAAQGGPLGIYCDPVHNPPAVARYLLEHCGVPAHAGVTVCSDMGTDAETVQATSLKRLARVKKGSGLSVMIVAREPRAARASFGLPDAAFSRERGMITRRDVRLIALSRLELQGADVLWDIGAASGSVAIEAANLFPGLRVFAVEQEARRHADLKRNIRSLCSGRVKPLHGRAPDALRGLPAPDRVFVGGSGDMLGAILRTVKKRLKAGGVLVLNCVSPDSLHAALSVLQRWGWTYCVTTVQLSNLDSARAPQIFRADNPVWVVQARA